MSAEPVPGFKRLVSLRARITIGCPRHGSHNAVVIGPYQEVLDIIYAFRMFCVERDRWVLTEYTPSEDDLPMAVGDWT